MNYKMWKRAEDLTKFRQQNRFGYGAAGGRGTSPSMQPPSMISTPVNPNVAGTNRDPLPSYARQIASNARQEHANQYALGGAQRMQEGMGGVANAGFLDESGNLSRDSRVGQIYAGAEDKLRDETRSAIYRRQFAKYMQPHVKARPTEADLTGMDSWFFPGSALRRKQERYDRRMKRHRLQAHDRARADADRAMQGWNTGELGDMRFTGPFNMNGLGMGNTLNVDENGNVRNEASGTPNTISANGNDHLTLQGYSNEVGARRAAFENELARLNIGMDPGSEASLAAMSAWQRAFDSNNRHGYTQEGLRRSANAFVRDPAIQRLRDTLIKEKNMDPLMVDAWLTREGMAAVNRSKIGQAPAPDFTTYRRGY